MEQVVIGCEDCPMYKDGVNYEYSHYCRHPKSPQKVLSFTAEPNIELVSEKKITEAGFDYTVLHPITPDWCPLNKEQLTIIKK